MNRVFATTTVSMTARAANVAVCAVENERDERRDTTGGPDRGLLLELKANALS